MKNKIYFNFFLLIISFIYIYLSFKILSIDLFDDLLVNIKQIKSFSSISEMPTLTQPYYYLQYTAFYFLKNPIFIQILTASISITIYINQFLKAKNYMFLINFLLLPITPVFFLSVNRFALSSSILLAAVDNYNEKRTFENNEFLLKKITLILISLLMHIGPFFILLVNCFNKNFVNEINFLIKKTFSKFLINKTIRIPLLLLTFICIILFLKIEFNTNQLFYQFRLVYSYFIELKFDFLQTIFILPFCYFYLIYKAIKDNNDYRFPKLLLINISTLFVLSTFIPIIWRYWILFMPLVTKLDKGNNLVLNIILFIYSLYLLPLYLSY